MSAGERCEMVLLVQAEFDGELDAAEAAALMAHRALCPICQAAGTELAAARELMREDLYEKLPEAARGRILGRLAAARPASPSRGPWQSLWRWWRQAAAGFALGAAAAAGLLLLVLSPAEEGLADQVLAGHLRALQPGHLEDVASTDRHTVKPWFDGRIDFAPPVKDLAAQGFPLLGGRLDYLAGRPVAALVYRRDKHIINLFIWPAERAADAPLRTVERQGYNIVHWSASGMRLWAVSDLERDQLRAFAEDWRRSP